MSLSSKQKKHVVKLIETGDKLDAVRYLQETLNLTADQALILTEKLEEELEGSPLQDEINALKEETLHPSTGINVGHVVGLTFMGIGAIMLALVAYFVYSNYQFTKHAVTVKAKVINYTSYESRDSDGGGLTTMFTPTFQYPYKGKLYTYKSTTSTSNKSYEIGETVEVLIDPDDPENILIPDFWDEWFVTVLLGFLCVLFSGMGYLVYRLLG